MSAPRIAAALAALSLVGAALSGGAQERDVAATVRTERLGEVEWLLDVAEASRRARATDRPMLLLVRCPP